MKGPEDIDIVTAILDEDPDLLMELAEDADKFIFE